MLGCLCSVRLVVILESFTKRGVLCRDSAIARNLVWDEDRCSFVSQLGRNDIERHSVGPIPTSFVYELVEEDTSAFCRTK